MYKDDGLDFSGVKTFNLDEYLGIGIDLEKPYEQDQSYARFMHEELFKHINIKKENIHIPDGLTKDPEKFCIWYEEEIKKVGGIDLQLLGIGGDGHWAFNEPGSSLASRTRVQALTKQTLDNPIVSVFFWLLLEAPIHISLILTVIGIYPDLELAFYTTALLFHLFEATFLLVQIVNYQMKPSTNPQDQEESHVLVH